MIAKESVKERMKTGISFTEFSYMLLQAYDFSEDFEKILLPNANGRFGSVG